METYTTMQQFFVHVHAHHRLVLLLTKFISYALRRL